MNTASKDVDSWNSSEKILSFRTYRDEGDNKWKLYNPAVVAVMTHVYTQFWNNKKLTINWLLAFKPGT